ncbi:PIN domain-containing protein [Streptomyces rochei]|uniref:PIN domain-containing protein n=1 Tax=Streptomyces rochei TaxID=1928 RepID=UPI00363CE687
MRRVMFDSNAIDPIADTSGAFEALQEATKAGRLEILYTHVTIDELVAIPDLDRRQHLTLLMVELGKLVPTGATVLDFSRLNFCRLGADDEQDMLEELRSQNIRHSRDALIGITARTEGCALVTNDERLAKRAAEIGVETLTTRTLLDEVANWL